MRYVIKPVAKKPVTSNVQRPRMTSEEVAERIADRGRTKIPETELSEGRKAFEALRKNILAMSKLPDDVLDEIIGEIEDASESLSSALTTAEDLTAEGI